VPQRLSVTISIAALAVSMGTFYLTSLAPFEVGITVGPITWQPVDRQGRFPQLGAPRDRTFPNMTMVAPFTFTHHGARPGVIEDLVVTLRDMATGQSVWRFDPEVEVNESVFMTDFSPDAHTRWIHGRFRQISLVRGQQIDKFILFTPHYVGSGQQRLDAGSYRLTIWTRLQREVKFQPVVERVEELSSQLLDDIVRGDRWSQTPRAVIELRNGIK
jgi:hypothetical protein